MPESKNTFIQSKMNQDMDGRILPNGQYREGLNIQISRSEGADVGALENVLGNDFLTNWNLEGDDLTTIGGYFDDTSNNIYLFITNYTDSSPSQLDNPTNSAEGVLCYIVQYNVQNKVPRILVEGNFLNFSTTHLITGINLLEDLLFWTDNRNQPRKINVNLAQPGYYVTEDQISVAKYYPYTSPLLLEFTPGASPTNPKFLSTMKDRTTTYLPIHTAAKILSIDAGSNTITLVGCYTNIKPELH